MKQETHESAYLPGVRDRGESFINFRQNGANLSDFSQMKGWNNSENLLSSLKSLMERSIYEASKSRLETRDQKVTFQLPRSRDEEQINDDHLREWTAQLCTHVFSQAFHSYSKDDLTEKEAKIFICQNILRNIFFLTKKCQLSDRQMKIIDEHMKGQVFPYLKLKYALKISNKYSRLIDTWSKDNSQSLQFNILFRSDIIFKYREDGNYNDLIMRFINWLITSYNKVDKETNKVVAHQFADFFNNLIQNLNGDGQKNEAQKSIMNEYEQLLERDTPLFTDAEIQNSELTIKHPAIFKILAKWSEQLWNKFATKNYYLDSEENLRVQENGGNINTLFMWMKIPLNKRMEEEKIKIQEFLSAMGQNIYEQHSQLLLKELIQDGHNHIDRVERSCGKFASQTLQNMHEHTIKFLNRLIHGLVCVSKNVYEKQLSTKARWTSPPDLTSFQISDLLKYRLIIKQNLIENLFKKLHETYDSKMSLIKITNQSKEGQTAIKINVFYKQTNINLIIGQKRPKKEEFSANFHHFISQLSQNFGFIYQLCNIWMTLDERSLEYAKCNKTEKKKKIQNSGYCKIIKDHSFIEIQMPFICSECSRGISHNEYVLSHRKCTKCQYKICARCWIATQEQQVLKQLLLMDKEHRVFKESCRPFMNSMKADIPEFGLLFEIESKKRTPIKYRKITLKNIVSIFAFFKENKGKEQIKLIVELQNKDSQRQFLQKYLILEVSEEIGKKYIDFTSANIKTSYLLPQKIKNIYSKQQEYISLTNQQLDDDQTHILMGLPEQMQKISSLQLSDNKFSNIRFITNNFINLNRLLLNRNKVQDIGTISRLTQLTKLNLRDNLLGSLPSEICDLKLLVNLDVRNNKLEKLPEHFGNLKSLRTLILCTNQLAQLPESFINLQKLTCIDISQNKLSSFPKSFKAFIKLRLINLSNNQLDTLPYWIKKFTDLEIFELSETSLSNFSDSMFKLKKLKILKIHTNVQLIPPLIRNMTTIEELRLNMPNLKALPIQFSYISKINCLELSHCQFQSIPDCIFSFKLLSTLVLIDNKISQIDPRISELKNLRILKIQQQLIDQLPSKIVNLTSLQTLSLNLNRFTQIPSQVFSLSQLLELSIKNNQIKSIPDNFFVRLPQLQTLALDANMLKALPSSILSLKNMKKCTYEGNQFDQTPTHQQFLNQLSKLLEEVSKNL